MVSEDAHTWRTEGVLGSFDNRVVMKGWAFVDRVTVAIEHGTSSPGRYVVFGGAKPLEFPIPIIFTPLGHWVTSSYHGSTATS